MPVSTLAVLTRRLPPAALLSRQATHQMYDGGIYPQEPCMHQTSSQTGNVAYRLTSAHWVLAKWSTACLRGDPPSFPPLSEHPESHLWSPADVRTSSHTCMVLKCGSSASRRYGMEAIAYFWLRHRSDLCDGCIVHARQAYCPTSRHCTFFTYPACLMTTAARPCIRTTSTHTDASCVAAARRSVSARYSYPSFEGCESSDQQVLILPRPDHERKTIMHDTTRLPGR